MVIQPALFPFVRLKSTLHTTPFPNRINKAVPTISATNELIFKSPQLRVKYRLAAKNVTKPAYTGLMNQPVCSPIDDRRRIPAPTANSIAELGKVRQECDITTDFLNPDPMPANLTPQYQKQSSLSPCRNAPGTNSVFAGNVARFKHKGTDKLQAELKAKIAAVKLKPQNLHQRAGGQQRFPSRGLAELSYWVPPTQEKSIVGFFNAGSAEIAVYPFTTQTPLPGMMLYEDCPFNSSICHRSPQTLWSLRHRDWYAGPTWYCWSWILPATLIEDTQAVLDRFAHSKRDLVANRIWTRTISASASPAHCVASTSAMTPSHRSAGPAG